MRELPWQPILSLARTWRASRWGTGGRTHIIIFCKYGNMEINVKCEKNPRMSHDVTSPPLEMAPACSHGTGVTVSAPTAPRPCQRHPSNPKAHEKTSLLRFKLSASLDSCYLSFNQIPIIILEPFVYILNQISLSQYSMNRSHRKKMKKDNYDSR